MVPRPCTIIKFKDLHTPISQMSSAGGITLPIFSHSSKFDENQLDSVAQAGFHCSTGTRLLQWTNTIDMSDLFCILLTPPFHLHHHSPIPSPFCNTNAGSSLIWWHLSPGPQASTKECRVGLNRVQSHYPPSVVYSIPRCLRWDNTSCITIFAYCKL